MFESRTAHEDPAAGRNALGPAESQEEPHGVIEVDTQVARLPVAELAARAPTARMNPRIVIPPRGRSDVHVPIERFRRLCVGRKIARPAIVTVNVDIGDLAKLAAVDELFACFQQVRRAAALQSDLDGPLVLAHGGDHGLSLDHVVADRLLHIDVAARLAGFDHRQAMPMIGSADEDDLRLLVRQQLAVVAVRGWLLLRRLPLCDQLGGFAHHLAIDIAQADDLHRCDLHQVEQVRLAIPATADQAHPQRFVVRGCISPRLQRGQRHRATNTRFQKIAPIDHGRSLSARRFLVFTSPHAASHLAV